ncbi:MAG: TolC family protein [Gallionella sp.]|nr:TolC family protein [Gallionella sp.]
MKSFLRKQRMSTICCLLFFSAVCVPGPASSLTLEAALATAESSHPDLLYAQAERDSALADKNIANSRQDANVNLEGILRSGRPSSGNQDLTSDNSVRLTARKTLYDFGRSSNAEVAAQFDLKAREADLTTAFDKRRLEIMARYFDVLLADMQYVVDNELMAVYYVSFDQGKDRLERGQISNVELVELESRYRETLVKRNVSAQRQRITRALLANAMNRPGDLPGDLEDPKFPGNQRTLPDYETLLPTLLNNNSRLHAQQEMLAASQKRLESLRAETGPTLDAEVQAADYSRTAATRDNLSAGLILSWPLYQGNRSDSRIAREMAQFNKLQAGAEKLKMELTQALLETWLDISHLQNAARDAARKYVEYRDLQLERSRGLYELELKSNLGTSMVGTAEANMRSRNIEYQLALSFARLEALMGMPLGQAGNK